MKIAVIDHVGNHGGGSRVVRSLLPALKRLDPGIRIDYFGNPSSIKREGLSSEFAAAGIAVFELQSLWLSDGVFLRFPYLCRVVQLAQGKFFKKLRWLPVAITGDVTKDVEQRIKRYDLAFFPWPFLMSFPKIDCPVVGLFHDFNYKYYFGGSFVYSQEQRTQLEHDMPEWLESAIPVVSTRFIASEIARFFPEAGAKTTVVHLPPLGGVELVDAVVAKDVVQKMGLHGPYIVYPLHMCSHKNVGPLIAAVALLREQGRDIKLVLTGAGTEAVVGYAEAIGVRLSNKAGDVIGLGYVSNLQMDSLIQGAVAVVSTSLYEAGNGPGLDAWGRGVPVAMSDIPAFREHLDEFGVRAQLFDPRIPSDIAEKISVILDQPGKSLADARHSRDVLGKRNWDQVTKEYLQIFNNTLGSTNTKRI